MCGAFPFSLLLLTLMAGLTVIRLGIGISPNAELIGDAFSSLQGPDYPDQSTDPDERRQPNGNILATDADKTMELTPNLIEII